MMECTPESGRYHSVYSVSTTVSEKKLRQNSKSSRVEKVRLDNEGRQTSIPQQKNIVRYTNDEVRDVTELVRNDSNRVFLSNNSNNRVNNGDAVSMMRLYGRLNLHNAESSIWPFTMSASLEGVRSRTTPMVQY
jgi:hypothetical protein